MDDMTYKELWGECFGLALFYDSDRESAMKLAADFRKFFDRGFDEGAKAFFERRGAEGSK